jgi:hypothetical protein
MRSGDTRSLARQIGDAGERAAAQAGGCSQSDMRQIPVEALICSPWKRFFLFWR